MFDWHNKQRSLEAGHCNPHLSKADTKAIPTVWNVSIQFFSSQNTFHVLLFITEIQETCDNTNAVVQKKKKINAIVDTKMATTR